MDLSNKKILSLCGGGIRGIAHLGVLKYLEENNIIKNIEIFSGTSIGAILVSLLILGYSVNDIFDFVLSLDFTRIFQFDKLETLTDHYGFDKGTRFDYIFKTLISNKGYDPDITLKELYDITKKKLIVTSTCLNTGNGEYIDHINNPDLQLKLAVRMSACIPLLMTPIIYNNKTYIDGGCTIPLPLIIFNNQIDELIAINLSFTNNYIEITNLELYIYSIFKTMYNNLTNIIYDNKKIPIIDIPINIFFTEFDIDKDKKKYVFDIGYKKMKELSE